MSPSNSHGQPARLVGATIVAADVPALRRLLVDAFGGVEVPSPGPASRSAACTVAFAPGLAFDLVDQATVEAAHGDGAWHDAGEGLHRLRFAVDDPGHVADRLATCGYHRSGSDDHVVMLAPPNTGGALELVTAADPAVEASAAEAGSRSGSLIQRVDHVCAPSHQLRTSLEVFRDILGGDAVFGGSAERLGVVTTQVRFEPGVKVEMLQPVRAGTTVGTFADAHPGRFHHVTMLTSDVPAAEQRLAAAGWDTIDTDLETDPDWHETYLRPSQAARVLIQLGRTDLSYKEPLDDARIEEILAGQWDADRYVMVPIGDAR